MFTSLATLVYIKYQYMILLAAPEPRIPPASTATIDPAAPPSRDVCRRGLEKTGEPQWAAARKEFKVWLRELIDAVSVS